MKTWNLIFLIVFSFGLVLISCTGKNAPLDNAANDPAQDTADVFITYAEIFKDVNSGYRVEDFDFFNDSVLFVHPAGAAGLYKYDMTSKEITELVDYSAGDMIAYDSIYVFYDWGHFDIMRFNLNTDTSDLHLDLSSFNDPSIGGLDVYQHVLYAIINSQNTENTYIAKFNLDGTLLDTIPYPRITRYLTINNGILYSLAVDTAYTITGFDLSTKSFLPDKPFPVEYGWGIRIFADKLYYADPDHECLAILPIP
jgi:hypothetical protein